MSLTSRYSHSCCGGRHAGEREQPQAGKGGNCFASLDEAWQRQAEPEQVRINGSDATHRDQADFHGMIPRNTKSAAAPIRNDTGMKNR